MQTLKLLLLSTLAVLYACGQDDDQTDPGNAVWECQVGIDESLFGKWESGLSSCSFDILPGEEPPLTLELKSDSTFVLSYEFIHPTSGNPDTLGGNEAGNFTFACTSRGVFTNRFTYTFVEGRLSLQLTDGRVREFDVRRDGFFGLQFSTRDLGLNFACPLNLMVR